MEVKSQRQDPSSSSSSLFKDISNFKTPKTPKRFRTFDNSYVSPYTESKYFTASKQTPQSSARKARSNAVRRLKAFELEQVKSARKAQIEKEKSLKSLAKSLTVWLNFLFENPSSCGCDVLKLTGEIGLSDVPEVRGNGKREIGSGCKVRADGGPWRGPKRQKSEETTKMAFTESKFLALKTSLKEICSFDDLKERMNVYLSSTSCKEIFETMSQVTKNIDESRLKMRSNCPIVTDVGMKEKAIKIFMSYNPIWLRIGLYIILGGDSLLPNGDVKSEQEIAFLRIVIEKQFFSHTGLAKNYSYNKLVEGLFRPGYYEKLGNVILKRFFLLVLILDRAKSQSSLPIKHGIDGLDGGSPLLFVIHSNIKSSSKLIQDFLSSEVMHGEGNLLTHLMLIGYKVTHQQIPLTEYDFRVTNLFDDLQDGVRLCRAIQLLQHDSSILMKMVVPSDTRKKSLVNCGTALQFLKQASVPLIDEDGIVIEGDDIINGEKELILSMLWNMFVHLQVPLLVNKKILEEEIFKIRGVVQEYPSSHTLLDMLLGWIQAICGSHDFKVTDFSSLIDGKAMWCLLDYYFRKEHTCSTSFKGLDYGNGEVSIVSAKDYTDAVHNFILSQKLTSLLGKFPEVLQMSDLLEHNGACSDRSVIILLVFLSSQLLVKRNTDQLNFHKLLGFNCQTPERRRLSTERWFKQSEAVLNIKELDQENNEGAVARDFNAIMAWWKDMAQENQKKPPCKIEKENAARIIQSHFRRSVEHSRYLKIKRAVCILQSVTRAWLLVKKKYSLGIFNGTDGAKYTQNPSKYAILLIDRHNYVNTKSSVLTIQSSIRNFISQKRLIKASITIQKHFRGQKVRSNLAQAKKKTLELKENEANHRLKAVITIQQAFKHFHERKIEKLKLINEFNITEKAAITVQRRFRVRGAHKLFKESSAIIIQRFYRGYIERRRFLDKKQEILKIERENKSVIIIQSCIRGWIVRKDALIQRDCIVMLQSQCRGYLTRKDLSIKKEAASRIQSFFRFMKCLKLYTCQKQAAIQIQSFVRGESTRKRLLGASREKLQSLEIQRYNQCVLKLQRCWRGILVNRLKKRAAIVIQSHFRGWKARRSVIGEKKRIVLIQSYWKGYIARKNTKVELLDLRIRMEKSAANIDESKRLINRLITALKELLSMRSVRGILHTCSTLDMATEHSVRCCEELVKAGAVRTLLKLIQSVSQSIPDQEVLKHSLSTLKNLARYPHLAQVLIDTPDLVKIILWEFVRNKEGFFIASEILKKICANKKGVEAARKLPALVKRLRNLVEELAKKTGNGNRKVRGGIGKEEVEKRLKQANEIMQLIMRS